MSKEYECTKCGKRYTFWDGVGFAFPSVFMEVQSSAIKGEFGPELQKLLAEYSNAVVDASNRIYFCKKCGHWENVPSLDCYVPKEDTPKEGSMPWSVAMPSGGIPESEYRSIRLATPWELRRNYRLLKGYSHMCPDCGEKMTRFVNPPFAGKKEHKDILKLKCNECGGDIIDTGNELCID